MRFVRRRLLSDDDRAVWVIYVQQLRPLPGVTLPPVPLGESRNAGLPIITSVPLQPPPPRVRSRLGPLNIGTHPPGVDRGTWDRFRTGKLSASRTLDLHGRTAARAFDALRYFLAASHAERLRCIEIITGRGAGEGGVIRREFPLWLNLPELRPLVLAAAHPHAANPGSVRLLLRRVRD